MKLICTILLGFVLSGSAGQTPLGGGIVAITFNESTVVDFYESPTAKNASKRLEFFNDPTTQTFNILNLETHQSWLKPEVLWLDYSSFLFRCKSKSGSWFEVIVNNETGATLWLKKSDTIVYNTWEDFLKSTFSISRLESHKQKIRSQPDDTSEELTYRGRDCFRVRSVKGDWMEIYTGSFCNENKIESGWIRWRKGNALLIDYSLTS